MKEALRRMMERAENHLHKIRLSDVERIEKLLAERNSPNARLDEITAALCNIIRGREEKNDKIRHAQQCQEVT